MAQVSLRHVPKDPSQRLSIFDLARDKVSSISRSHCLELPALEEVGGSVLKELSLPETYLGFAMVAVDNAFWQSQFAATPFNERLLLLPHCLRQEGNCPGTYDKVGLNCASCGQCVVSQLMEEAQELGYKVIVAEGTPVVVQEVINGRAKAVLGVACLDSLESAYSSITRMGIPHLSMPLLGDGCVATEVDVNALRKLISLQAPPPKEQPPLFTPLLKRSRDLLSTTKIKEALAPIAGKDLSHISKSLGATHDIATDWLSCEGKRFRPFITLAAHAVMAHGLKVLKADCELDDYINEAIINLCLAIEVLHKASLVHDDIEDEDSQRYGQETVHQKHNIPIAINTGDYLIGLGYRLVTSTRNQLDDSCVADIVENLSQAHLQLSRGQGAELLERAKDPSEWSAKTLQTIYGLKTAPAFEAAFYAGIRSVCPLGEKEKPLKQYCKFLGIAYQVKNDLTDLDLDHKNRTAKDLERALLRPTLLRTFAKSKELEELEASALEASEKVNLIKALYENLGVIKKAKDYLKQCEERALAACETMAHKELEELMKLVLAVVLS